MSRIQLKRIPSNEASEASISARSMLQNVLQPSDDEEEQKDGSAIHTDRSNEETQLNRGTVLHTASGIGNLINKKLEKDTRAQEARAAAAREQKQDVDLCIAREELNRLNVASANPPVQQPVKSHVLRRLNHFMFLLSLTLGMNVDHMLQWNQFSDLDKWDERYAAVAKKGSKSDQDMMYYAKKRAELKQAFDVCVLKNMHQGKYALASALFFIQNRLKHTGMRLWDIIHDVDWQDKFLQLIKLTKRCNGMETRNIWSMHESYEQLKQLREWFSVAQAHSTVPPLPDEYWPGQWHYRYESTEDLHGEIPVMPLQLRDPEDMIVTSHAQELRNMIREASGDAHLRNAQLQVYQDHLFAQLKTDIFDTPSALVTHLKVKTHSRVVLAQYLAICHALSDTILQNHKDHKQSIRFSLPSKNMVLVLQARLASRLEWIKSFLSTGCACAS